MTDPAALARETAHKVVERAGIVYAKKGDFAAEHISGIIAAALDQYGDALARAIREENVKAVRDYFDAIKGKPSCEDIVTAIRALRGASQTEGE